MSTVQVELQDTNRRKIRLLKPLGKGGFGAVYLADVYSPEGLVQRMAVKLLHEEFARDNQLAARARDEARLMSQLNHDHVVKVHAQGGGGVLDDRRADPWGQATLAGAVGGV